MNYGLKMSYEQFHRHGYMRNGRAPENSFGPSKTIRFNDASVKVGWDEQLNAFCNFALTGVHRQYKGIELGMAYQVTNDLRISFAGNFSRYRYVNNPTGVRSVENGLQPDKYSQFYLKNYYCTSTPMTAFNIAVAYNAPKQWYFNVDASWLADYYVRLAYPTRATK